MAKTTNIWIASADNDLEYVKKSISSGTHTANDKDNNGYTPIHAAVSYGHLDLLRYLVSQGGDVNITDNDGDTPLHSVEDVKVARVLIEEFGADWRRKNSSGQTALERVEEEDEDEFPELISYLKQLSGQPSTSNDNNFTPKVQYQTMDIDQSPVDIENRKKIEEIMESENPEEGLRVFMEEVVKNQFSQNGEEQEDNRKRQKKDN